ncbi:MAG: DNA-protecting protein DprA [Phycisphaerales bacterium]|nr:DNA-protecting protein DprA [Phycisphaerales bacterium]
MSEPRHNLGAPVDTAQLFHLLRLTFTQGLGPVLISRLLQRTGSAEAALALSPSQLRTIDGIGPSKAASIAMSMAATADAARAELELAQGLGVRIITLGDPRYPPLLAEIPSPPPLIYVKGTIDHAGLDRFPAAIVGSRDCTHYGLEQARRFAGGLASAGVTIVSGGARGIDSAAHLGALNSGGRTIAVLGCGLATIYPPENRELFERVVASGALVSELPLTTAPAPENFPARNRIISGLSLGVLVVEAGLKSGALITAQVATEDHGREVLAVPGRVDSPASRGTLDLLRSGGAAMAIDPADVIAVLESPAHHLASGTHQARFAPSTSPQALFTESAPPPPARLAASPRQIAILASLDEVATIEQLSAKTGLAASELRSDLTLLEIQGRVRRSGARFCRT